MELKLKQRKKKSVCCFPHPKPSILEKSNILHCDRLLESRADPLNNTEMSETQLLTFMELLVVMDVGTGLWFHLT